VIPAHNWSLRTEPALEPLFLCAASTGVTPWAQHVRQQAPRVWPLSPPRTSISAIGLRPSPEPGDNWRRTSPTFEWDGTRVWMSLLGVTSLNTCWCRVRLCNLLLKRSQSCRLRS
jgi:hypothetical protein